MSQLLRQSRDFPLVDEPFAVLGTMAARQRHQPACDSPREPICHAVESIADVVARGATAEVVPNSAWHCGQTRRRRRQVAAGAIRAGSSTLTRP